LAQDLLDLRLARGLLGLPQPPGGGPELDDRVVVGVARRRARPVAQRVATADELAAGDPLAGLGLRGDGALPRHPTDERDDRADRLDVVPPDLRILEDVREGAGDDPELLRGELVRLEPLGEDAARLEARARDLEALGGVEIAGSGVPGDEEVAHDGIEAL